jgi:hypothetical protein
MDVKIAEFLLRFFMEEIWKPIPGYETHYAASNLGRIKSIQRTVKDTKDGKERSRVFKEKILRFNYGQKDGRPSVMLSVQGNTVRVLVARLVCLTFHGKPPEGKKLVLHYDDNNQNNVITNLRWGDYNENLDDCIRNRGSHPAYIDGRSKRPRKKVGDPLLNEAQVRVLRRLPDMRTLRGIRSALAKAWGVKPSTLSSAKDGSKGWVDLTAESLWDMAERLDGDLLGRDRLKENIPSL